jgi:hypothetical protein
MWAQLYVCKEAQPNKLNETRVTITPVYQLYSSVPYISLAGIFLQLNNVDIFFLSFRHSKSVGIFLFIKCIRMTFRAKKPYRKPE